MQVPLGTRLVGWIAPPAHRTRLPPPPAEKQGGRTAEGEGTPVFRGLSASRRGGGRGTSKRGGGGNSSGRGRSRSGSSSSAKPPRQGAPPSTRGFAARPGKGTESDDEGAEDDEQEENSWTSSDDSLAISAALGELSDSEVAELLGQDISGPDVLAGADVQVEADLAEALKEFTFELDAFQISSVRRILSGRSVVVCAPTGAGKTAIAEAAATHFLRRGGRVLYTTPLKALSNQKLGELRARFGTDQSGLQTGDASINVDANIVVMTTEILRNILYRTENELPTGSGTSNGTGTSGGTAPGEGTEYAISTIPSTASPKTYSNGGSAAERLAGVKLVVFDECHYLGDPGRGSAWEEAIINLPPDILILAMSATVRNPADLSGWISSVHGPCETVTTSFRPVPLRWQYCLSAGDDTAALLPLLDARGRALNPRLLPPSERLEAAAKEEAWGRWDGLSDGKKEKESWDRASSSIRTRTLDELVNALEEGDAWHRMTRTQRVPSMESVVRELWRADMLPAIWFIFSRKECDASAARLSGSGMRLTTDTERDEILLEVAALRAEQPEVVKETSVPALAAGLAAHHAGLLPGWKALVERLFQRGLVKIVFATETLAAGINMPARTTLLSALSRRRDAGIVGLTHNELLQMAGRAGRRGYDTLGHCVVVQNRWEGPEFAFDIIRKGPEPLRSQFSTSYGMALNLLWSRSMTEARAFLDRSFSRHLGGAGAQRTRGEIEVLEAKAQTILDEAAKRAGGALPDAQAGGGGLLDVETVWVQYQKLQGKRREEKRAARLLRAQLAEERGATADAALTHLGLPRGVGLDLSGSNIDDSGYRLPALAVSRIDLRIAEGRGRDSGSFATTPGASYLCLGADNVIYFVDSRHICGVEQAEDLSQTSEDERDERQQRIEDAAQTIMEFADSLRRGAWRDLSSGVSAADGSALTASLAITEIPPAAKMVPTMPSEEGLEGLRLQRERVSVVKTELDSMRGDKAFAKASKKYAQAASKATVLLERASGLREELEGRLGGGWRDFENVVDVLEAARAFEPLATSSSVVGSSSKGSSDSADGDGGRRRFAPLGLVAREMRGANELWMAVALTHPALQTLPAPQLAAVVSALVAPDAFNRANVYVAYPPSPGVTAAVEALEPARGELAGVQLRKGLDAPTGLDLRLAGVVEAWASGVGWAEVTADCGLDDGDVARLLMRTVDVLRQAAFCAHLLPTLRQAARQAAKNMDRTPISDLVT